MAKVLGRSAFVIACILLYVFVITSLASYEEHYNATQGPWYSTESMKSHQYLAYLMTYVLSLPVGLPFMLASPDFFSANWLPVSAINLVFWYMTGAWMLRKRKTAKKRKP
jgi:hypothetical protein